MILGVTALLFLPTWFLWERFGYMLKPLKDWVEAHPLLLVCVFIALSHLSILVFIFSVVGK